MPKKTIKMNNRPYFSSVEAVVQAIGDLKGLSLIDIGCGTGEECRGFANLGAKVTGIDPNSKVIELARKEDGGPQYLAATADDARLEDHSYDLIFFGKSLHHIPDMKAALNDAMRLVKPTGKIIVLEPQADDPLYPVICGIDDEKPVYLEAQKAIDSAITAETLTRKSTFYFAGKYRYGSVQDIIAHMLEVDDSRLVSDEVVAKMEAAYQQAVRRDEDGAFIAHWYRLDVLQIA
jgi:ubiquinone/menaquinone biosynthesis C-methylase UbiE